MTFKQWLISKRACHPAIEWVGDRTAEQAWAECTNGEWMGWTYRATNPPKRLSVQVAVHAALSVVHLNPDPRVTNAIETAQAWLDGRATEGGCLKAANAAYAAADAADAAYAAADAAYAAADAAACAAADAAACAATYAAARAATYAADDDDDIYRAVISPEQFAALVREAP